MRLIDETDADIPTIVMAYVAVDECYGLKWLNEAIDALDTCIDGQVQLSLYASVQDLLLSRMVWMSVPSSRKWRLTASQAPRAVIPIFLWS